LRFGVDEGYSSRRRFEFPMGPTSGDGFESVGCVGDPVCPQDAGTLDTWGLKAWTLVYGGISGWFGDAVSPAVGIGCLLGDAPGLRGAVRHHKEAAAGSDHAVTAFGVILAF